MLTFFEYLRQRAFESVMTGAYEALELLEAKKSLEEPKEQLPPPRLRTTPTKPTQSAPNSAPNPTAEQPAASQPETDKHGAEKGLTTQRKQSGVHNLKKLKGSK